MLGEMSEVLMHFSRLAEVGKASIKDDPLINIQEFVRVLADLSSVVSDQYNRNPFVLVKLFDELEETFP